MGLCIRNARVMDPGTNLDRISDIFIEGDRITDIIPSSSGQNHSIPGDFTTINADGLIAAPGLIDVHVHFRDPGFTYKEDIFTGSKAAVCGGYTTVVLMANTNPTVDNPDTLKYVLDKSREAEKITPLHILSAATVSRGMKGLEINDFDTLAESGAAGFTDDGKPIMDEELLREAFIRAAKLNLPVSLHEEDPSFITQNGINAGKSAYKLGLTGSPREAEISLIERDLIIATKLFTEEGIAADVNIQHISTKEGVELVRKYRGINPHVHAEATPHHFSLTEDDVITYGTLAKMNPPLRCEEDRLAIIEGLKDGTIEIIATDHAPHSKEEKSRDFADAPSGIIGLETALALGITNLVKPGHLSILELIRKMTEGPANLYRLQSGISVGGPADIVLFNPDEQYTVGSFNSKSDNSPFTGMNLYGVIHATICGGEISYLRPDNK